MEQPPSPQSGPPPIQNPPQPPPGLPLTSPQNAHQGPYHPNPEERTMGMLIHLLSLLTGFVGPLVLWLIKREESRFVDFHGKECINFNLSMLLYSAILLVISVVVALATMGVGVFFIFPLFLVVGIGLFILEIMACVSANKGEWHRIPMSIRFIQ